MWFEPKNPLTQKAPIHQEVAHKKEAKEITNKTIIKPKKEPPTDEELDEREEQEEQKEPEKAEPESDAFPKCSICKESITNCKTCGKEFHKGDDVECFYGSHFCSEDCYKNRPLPFKPGESDYYNKNRSEVDENNNPNPNSIREIITLEDYLYCINNNDWNNLNYIGKYLERLFKEPYINYEHTLQILKEKDVDNKIINYAQNRQQELWEEKELNFISQHPEWSFRIGDKGLEDNRTGSFLLTQEVQKEARIPAFYIETIYPLYIETLKLKILSQYNNISTINYIIKHKYSDNTVVEEKKTESSLLIPEEAEIIKTFPISIKNGKEIKDINGSSYNIYIHQGNFYRGYKR